MRIALPWVTLLALLAGCPSNPAVDDDDDAVDDDDTVESQDPREGFCDPGTEIAYVRLINYGKTTTVLAEAFDAPDVTIGTPALVAGDCAYHVHDRAACGGCDLGDVCSQTGGCVVRRSPVLGSTIAVTIDGVEQNFEANEFGQIWSDLGPITTDIETSLSWDGTVASAPAWSPPTGDIGPVVAVSGEWDAPGELIVTWTDQGESALVTTTVPINHHVPDSTFVHCVSAESTEMFSAPAEMIDPLAVITGLEFQDLEHERALCCTGRGGLCAVPRVDLGLRSAGTVAPTPPAAVPDARGGLLR